MRILTDTACMEAACRKALTMVKAVGPRWWYECTTCGATCTEVQGIDGIHRWVKGTDPMYKPEAPSFYLGRGAV